ncbi:hypothetical protein BJ508DRAFT_325293 [Ascobolus immersus RN42]|uniref:F-box domain-containing protein n=1 Tax=Ascobolus immersus RN42 TaxID=1160509 RepID=A0A3N4IEH5_ASCIM|nr:hypothetical protein BJ508DRAFT_325293 [Ascobolus immersus RN42]
MSRHLLLSDFIKSGSKQRKKAPRVQQNQPTPLTSSHSVAGRIAAYAQQPGQHLLPKSETSKQVVAPLTGSLFDRLVAQSHLPRNVGRRNYLPAPTYTPISRLPEAPHQTRPTTTTLPIAPQQQLIYQAEPVYYQRTASTPVSVPSKEPEEPAPPPPAPIRPSLPAPAPLPSGPTLTALPTELRLEIYTHLSAFSLLNLSHASRHLYREINSSPKIYKKSPGYFGPAPPKSESADKATKPNLEPLRFGLLEPPTVDGRLSIRNIQYVASRAEWRLYFRLSFQRTAYAHQPEYGCCRKCRHVKQRGEFMVFLIPAKSAAPAELEKGKKKFAIIASMAGFTKRRWDVECLECRKDLHGFGKMKREEWSK